VISVDDLLALGVELKLELEPDLVDEVTDNVSLDDKEVEVALELVEERTELLLVDGDTVELALAVDEVTESVLPVDDAVELEELVSDEEAVIVSLEGEGT
jgi:hypothetical protein